jgi:hypothetical protein
MLDELEQPVVGPVDVLEHEHERVLLRERLPEAAPSRERFFLRTRSGARLPDERTQMRQDPLRVLVEHLLDSARELCVRLRVAVRLQDSRLRLHHLGERPVADALSIGERASLAPVGQLAAVRDVGEELADKATLADPRNADDRHQLRRTLLAHEGKRVDDLRELALAADERRALLRCEIDAEACSGGDDFPHANRRLLPLRLDRLVLRVVDRLRRRAVRRLADKDAVHRRR